MNIPDELLAAYVDGELEGAEQVRVEEAIARDSRIAQRVAYHRALREQLRGSFDGALHEPIPQRLLDAARVAAPTGTADVIDLARVRAARAKRPESVRAPVARRIAIAASVIAGLCVGLFVERLSDSSALTAYRHGAVVARGSLERALDAQLASATPEGSKVRVGLSFKDRAGAYCRTFAVDAERALAGLACRGDDRWQIQTLLDQGAASGASQGMRMAGSSLPPLLLQAVNDRISGEALDVNAEERAREHGWQ